MKIAESFSLPALSDDEDEDILGKETVSGRSMTAAARTPSGTPLLTDGFGMYTAAVGGLRTASRDISSSASRKGTRGSQRRNKSPSSPKSAKSSNDEDEDDEAAAARRRYLNKKEIIAPVDPNSLPSELMGPVGHGPPFVWNPGQFDSIQDSQIRTTSILSNDALDAAHFAPPRPAQIYPRPRSSSNSAKVLGKSYEGPGYESPVQLSTSEFSEMSQLRGTTFSPFSVQQGRPRPPGVTHDAPWDGSIRNVVQKKLWRHTGGECDRTALPTTKQGHRARTAPHFSMAEEARMRGHSTRGISSPIQSECNGRYPIVNGSGIAGGAGKRGGGYKDGYKDPRDYSQTFSVKPVDPKSGQTLVQFENSFMHSSNLVATSPLASKVTDNSIISGRGASSIKSPKQGARGLSPNSRRRHCDVEYTIHDDPLSSLDPKVLQLLNEKNIMSRLWPASRMDVRMNVRDRFATASDKFKDSEIIGTKNLGYRYMSQGLDSLKNFHPTDEVDCLDSKSLVQQERQGNEFPTAPWDGTLRNIAATEIGLWRDPGWDLKDPLGKDPKKALRSSTASLANS